MEGENRFKIKEINFEGYVLFITRAHEESTKRFEKFMHEREEKLKKMLIAICEGEKKISRENGEKKRASENGEKGVEGDKRCEEGYIVSLTHASDERKEKIEEDYKKVIEEREKREDEREEKYMKRLTALLKGERKVNKENGEKGVESDKRFNESYVLSLTNANDKSKKKLKKTDEECKKIIVDTEKKIQEKGNDMVRKRRKVKQ